MEGNSDTLDQLTKAVHRINTNDLPEDEYREIVNMIIADAQSLLDESGGE